MKEATIAVPVSDPPRALNYRLVLLLAGGYNIAFGVLGVALPNGFFDLFQMDRPRYPASWQVVAMVVGLYGLLYLYGAWRLEAAAPIVAVGLAGKLLGPVGWLMTVGSGQFPVRTLPLILFDDIVWWLPFGLFLLEGRRVGERLRGLAPYACAAVNLAAAVALAAWLRPGTETAGDDAARIAYISTNQLAWRGGWACWVAAALSLLGFYAWWGARLGARAWAVAALLVACTGLVLDLSAEALLATWLPRDFASVAPLATLLTGVGGNGLYTIAGIMLTVATPGLGRVHRAWATVMWAAGLGVSAFAFLHSFTAVGVCTAILFILFCPWCLAIGRRLA